MLHMVRETLPFMMFTFFMHVASESKLEQKKSELILQLNFTTARFFMNQKQFQS